MSASVICINLYKIYIKEVKKEPLLEKSVMLLLVLLSCLVVSVYYVQ